MMMVKNLLERVRTIQFLGQVGREESIAILTRAFLELNVSLRFILKENTNNRARSYYYNNRIQSMQKLMNMQRSDSKFDLKLNKTEIESLKKSVPEANSIEDYISYYEKRWNKMFSTKTSKAKKKRQYKKWYALNWEYNTFKDMMKSVGIEESLYHFFYGLSSIDSHGMGAIGNMQINESNYKITGAIPSYLCYAMIENNLASVIYELSGYYGLLADETQTLIFREMANSSVFT